MKPKLLYLMHVPWGWIKQRPHFIAEKLNKSFDVSVYAMEPLRGQDKKHLKRNLSSLTSIHKLILAGHFKPIIRKTPIFRWLYDLFFRLQIRHLNKYKYIWITNITIYPHIEKLIKPWQIVIYDCMDDDLEFPEIKNNIELKNYYLNLEKKILCRSNKVIFSAEYLKNKVSQRSQVDSNKSIVINNGIDIPVNSIQLKPKIPDHIQLLINHLKGNQPNALYIGTIAEWINFDLILKSIKVNPTLKYYFVGPLSTSMPQHPNIIHLGSVERDYVFSLMNEANALIMPFKVTELIKSVNPVKLYEYIYANKAVIAPSYSEIKVFEPYIYTYSTESEYLDLCGQIGNSLQKKNSNSKNNEFVKCSTWDSRVKMILDFINS